MHSFHKHQTACIQKTSVNGYKSTNLSSFEYSKNEIILYKCHRITFAINTKHQKVYGNCVYNKAWCGKWVYSCSSQRGILTADPWWHSAELNASYSSNLCAYLLPPQSLKSVPWVIHCWVMNLTRHYNDIGTCLLLVFFLDINNVQLFSFVSYNPCTDCVSRLLINDVL